MKNGTRVRFTVDRLGASEINNLGVIVAEPWGIGDEGVVSFPHPNRNLANEGWVYVEVRSRIDGRPLYVGVSQRMIEVCQP